ncbi:MAG: ATP-dependent helicase [Bacteroidetes bacterium]|nr:ATP-dependent helicase [Bacteroidota bacterium]
MQNNFKENINQILGKLNSKQRLAVEKIDGPVMVIAGPGTGKTQILAARIANILANTDTDAKSILCLTYTDAGARAMQKRLVDMIGTEAYNVSIRTFHSFGAEVIRENEGLFSNRELKPLSELESEQIIREILEEMPENSMLKSGKEYLYHADNLKKIFKAIKEQGIKITNFLKDIDTYIKEMPQMDEFIYKTNRGNKKKGDPKDGKIEEVRKKLENLKEAIQQYENYLKKMEKKGRYDYADMLLWVRDAFEKYPYLLLSYREKYLYILVDEFQDTNGIQAQILNQLAKVEEEPNVFIVGDDDQSIYSFQGANYERMLDFDKDYNPFTVVLDINYRSSQKILDASKALIENNTQRLVEKKKGLTKELTAGNDEYKDLPNPPKIVEYSVNNQEAVVIAGEIENLIKEQNVKPKDIAVIYRKHAQAIEISKYLASKGIPIITARPVNILEESMIQNMLTLLNYINMESKKPFSADYLLFEILHYDFFGFEPIDIAKFAHEISGKKLSNWRSVIAEKTQKPSQTELFENNDFITKLRRVHENLEYWIRQSHNLTIAQLVERIIAKGGFLTYALQSEQKNWNMQVLKTFFDYIKDEVERTPYLKLADFLDSIKLMKEIKLGIEVKRVYGSDEGVNMLTAHASKGLEFDYVFIIGCTQKEWNFKNSSLPFDMSRIMRDNNQYGNVKDDKDAGIEEGRRLFFVALTRAKKFVQVSYSIEDDNASQYVTELLNSGTCEKLQGERTTDIIKNEEALTVDFIASQFIRNEDINSNTVEDDWLNNFVNNYNMSVSHLNKYLRCPVSFYYETVLKIPTAKNKYMGFGSAIHDTLDAWIKAANENKETHGNFWDADRLCQEFEKQMGNQRDAFTESDFAQLMNYGKEKLKQYYNYKIDYILSIPKILTEQRIYTEMEGIKINGIADRLDFSGRTAHLIDYKTGKLDGINKKMNKPVPGALETTSFESRYGGDYWRQMVFYKILVEGANYDWHIDTATIECIEADKFDKISIAMMINPEDIEIVKNQIKKANAGIKSKEFRKGCGDKDCHWCNFEKKVLEGKNYEFESLPTDEEEI